MGHKPNKETSIQTWVVIIKGVSSTQITLSDIELSELACRTNKWAAALLHLRTWFASHTLNSYRHRLDPSMAFWMELGGRFWLERAVITIVASPSTITSLRPKSRARKIPSSVALASTSRALNGRGKFLLIAPMSWPFSFRITTLIPQLPKSLNTAPSTLILYQPGLGGHHLALPRGACVGVVGVAKELCLNSSTYMVESLAILFVGLHLPSCLKAFLLFHSPYALVAKSSQSNSLGPSLSFHTMSMNSSWG